MYKTVKERLAAFIEFKGLSKNKFEQMCGLSRRYASNISKSIQPDKIERISLAFPELNTGWLLTGEGEMLRDLAPTPSPQGLFVPQQLVQMFNDMTKTARLQEENISKLTDLVNQLAGGDNAKKGLVG